MRLEFWLLYVRYERWYVHMYHLAQVWIFVLSAKV
jgi:hypothetical protein